MTPPSARYRARSPHSVVSVVAHDVVDEAVFGGQYRVVDVGVDGQGDRGAPVAADGADRVVSGYVALGGPVTAAAAERDEEDAQSVPGAGHTGAVTAGGGHRAAHLPRLRRGQQRAVSDRAPEPDQVGERTSASTP